MAASEKVWERPRLPLLAANHAISLSSQISKEPRALSAALYAGQLVVRYFGGTGFVIGRRKSGSGCQDQAATVPDLCNKAATSCDGTLCTTAQFTSVRVVCNNTLQMAVADNSGAVKVPHSTRFDPKAVKESLGIGLSAWDGFISNIKGLANRPVSGMEATQFFSDVLDEQVLDLEGGPTSKAMQQVTALYSGAGMGSLLPGARGTAWGLLNAVTEFVDHQRRARSQDYRLDSAWFGQGAQLKAKALDTALKLVA